MTDTLPATDSTIRPVRRVQLFFPPMLFSRSQSRQTAMFPLGLGMIAAVLERAGYQVSLVDCPSEGYETLIDMGKDRYVYGLSAEEIRRRIEAFRPHAIGLSCLFSTLEKQMLAIATIAKQVDPEIVVICGGPHVSALYRRLLADPAVDYCVAGEGEQVVLDLIAALNRAGDGLEDVAALSFRRNGTVHYRPAEAWITDLDSLPFPARHLLDQEPYFRIGKVQGLRRDGSDRLRIAQMATSRGCPFRCSYCATNLTWGRRLRTRSAGNVLDEIEHLVERYGVERIAFQDDNLTADMPRAAEIFDGIVERKLPITWEAYNGLGVGFLDAELLGKMKASGCVGFTIAVEAASDTTLQRVRKPNYIATAPAVVDEAKRLGIDVRGFFMIGFPGESMDEVRRTVAYARQLDLSVSGFALVTPLPGTRLYDECVEQGLLNETTIDFEDLTFGGLELRLSEVPVEELKAIRKLEWLEGVLVDRKTGGIKADLKMSRSDVFEELENGLRLFPDNERLPDLARKARVYFGA